MQSGSSRIWTRVAVSISYDDNHYTTGISLLYRHERVEVAAIEERERVREKERLRDQPRTAIIDTTLGTDIQGLTSASTYWLLSVSDRIPSPDNESLVII